RPGERVPSGAAGAGPGCPAAGRSGRAEPAHELLEDVLGREVAAAGAAGAAAGPGAAEACSETGKARLAVGVDLATVILAALFGVGQEVIGRRNLGEFRLRLGVVPVLVGVVRLGQLA